ncbi:MAG: hypothetical protein GWO38_23205 [Phycisphaerae bacterium]|nr:hypothetical protein [Phycisphaerae bacterium]NIP54456.1 hypothetical protein [Phycisphaerae bacterium]NIX01520.1 hypothetical protein [Phycisphaerae bacterium]NIX30463.1 hypothetical protein [Phycisphaerae bacterium]
MEVIKPNKETLKTVDQILAINRQILTQNAEILEKALNPAIILPMEDRGRVRASQPQPGEIIYE